MKARTINFDERRYKEAFEPLDEALSLLSLQDNESLKQLVNLGKEIVKVVSQLVHGYIILTIAYYRERRYGKAYKTIKKAVEYSWDYAIIPILGFSYYHYKNHFQFVLSSREIQEKERSNITSGPYHVRVEHEHQEEILDLLKLAIDLISFKNHFTYPESRLFSPSGFQEILDTCGLDTPFHVFFKEYVGQEIETRYDRAGHIWTDSDRSLVVFTDYEITNFDKEGCSLDFIIIEGEADQIIRFNFLLHERLKKISTKEKGYQYYAPIPPDHEWVPGRFFRNFK